MEDTKSGGKLGPAGLFALAVLAGFLVVAIWYALDVWTSLSGVRMSVYGWIFMILGAVVTLVLGAGLMALVFYSSRHDMDR